MIRTEQVGVWAVWTKKGHRPTRFYNSKELAQAEAARLAGLNPKSKFHVVYFDEKVSWQEEDAPQSIEGKKAQFVRRLRGWAGDARLYRMTPPLEGKEYVVVSAVMSDFSGPETAIFPSNENGSFGMPQLDGGIDGALDHVAALANAGYEVTA